MLGCAASRQGNSQHGAQERSVTSKTANEPWIHIHTCVCVCVCVCSGRTLFITPGGIYEQVHTDPKQEQLYLPKRLGWIRLAIE